MDEERKEKLRQRDIRAHEIAKEITEKWADSQWQVDEFITMIKANFEWPQIRRKPEIFDYPINRYGTKIELPGTEAPGKEN